MAGSRSHSSWGTTSGPLSSTRDPHSPNFTQKYITIIRHGHLLSSGSLIDTSTGWVLWAPIYWLRKQKFKCVHSYSFLLRLQSLIPSRVPCISDLQFILCPLSAQNSWSQWILIAYRKPDGWVLGSHCKLRHPRAQECGAQIGFCTQKTWQGWTSH